MRARKRVFLGGLLAGLILFGGFGVLLWYATFQGPQFIYRQLFFALALLLFATSLLVLGGLGGIVYSIWTGRTQSFLRGPTRIVITRLLPLVIRWGRLFHIAKERVEQSFIEVNNSLVRAQAQSKLRAEQILVLAPHCLQLADCGHRITTDIHNCQRCGACTVADLLAVEEEYGVQVAVVTGGSLARKIVQKSQPRAIVAIACERDLTSGIQDIHPLPTIGVLNERPQGPCFNTQVDIERVKEGIEFFLHPKEMASDGI